MLTTSGPRGAVAGRRHLLFALSAARCAVLFVPARCSPSTSICTASIENVGRFNIWGYRGRPLPAARQPGEYRVVVLGGSAAYGYGVDGGTRPCRQCSSTAFAAAAPAVPSRVINLGYNNEGAYSFAVVQRDYAYLNYDLAFLYEGYNDLMGDPHEPNVSVFRHESPVFRVTGYLPIFPIVFQEKAAAMLHGDIGSMYASPRKDRVQHRHRSRTCRRRLLDATRGGR